MHQAPYPSSTAGACSHSRTRPYPIPPKNNAGKWIGVGVAVVASLIGVGSCASFLSDYVSVDITVWRNAEEPTAES